MRALVKRLALRVLCYGYAKDDPTQTAFHELRHQIQELRSERDQWKLRAIVNQLKAQ